MVTTRITGSTGRRDVFPRVLVAPDAFKGTASATEITAGMSEGAERAGWVADRCPLSDGGEGFLDVLDVLGGEEKSSTVTGPLGKPVDAPWRLSGHLAVVESARASGLLLAGGAEGNDPIGATSRGTGEVIVAALRCGATKIMVGVGGSATTDGGSGALEAIEEAGGLNGVEVLIACDVTAGFLEAARIFGPQKGATPEQITGARRASQRHFSAATGAVVSTSRAWRDPARPEVSPGALSSQVGELSPDSSWSQGWSVSRPGSRTPVLSSRAKVGSIRLRGRARSWAAWCRVQQRHKEAPSGSRSGFRGRSRSRCASGGTPRRRGSVRTVRARPGPPRRAGLCITRHRDATELANRWPRRVHGFYTAQGERGIPALEHDAQHVGRLLSKLRQRPVAVGSHT